MRWVYEWEDTEYYQMLVELWSITSTWTDQSWIEYKQQLMRRQGIMLLSTEEYNMAQAQYHWNALSHTTGILLIPVDQGNSRRPERKPTGID
jgi:hypothetical protein